MRLVSLRTVVAFLLAPWAPTIIVAILTGGFALSGDWWFVVMIAAGVSYGGVILIGVPVVFILAGFGVLNLVTLAVAGALGGIPVFGAVVVFIDRMFNNAPEWEYGLWGAPFGLVAALAFGFIAGVPLRARATGS